MDYRESAAYLDGLGKYGSNLGLNRIKRLLDLMGNPEKKLKVIHVAGTNGKGSVTAMLASILEAGGYRVGVYTSPHFFSYRERIRICGKKILREEFAQIITRLRQVVENDPQLSLDHPTQFEFLTALAIVYFANASTDIVILEVGLGGRLDATNVVEPILAVITSISLEHTEILGNNLRDIAREKAGIIKHGVEVVVAPQSDEALEMILAVCKEQNAKPYLVQEKLLWTVEKVEPDGQWIKFTGETIYKFKVSLLGLWQSENAAVALLAALALCNRGFYLDEKILSEGFANAYWPGRFEVIHKDPVIILDGAHNPSGASALVDSLKRYFPDKKIRLILGVLQDKDLEGIARPLSILADKVAIVPVNTERARKTAEIAEVVRKYNKNVSIGAEAIEVLKKMKEEEDEGVICVCGSLYLVGEIKKYLSEQKRKLPLVNSDNPQ